jgi:4-amino-4-deoxy-L-arabinose transferase-like glycosyltransferase
MSIVWAKIRGLHWSQWLSVLGLAVLFIALRWNNFNAPLIRDEGEYAYSAQLLIRGIAPYQHAFIQKPPGIVYSYALANLFLPQYFWSPRLLAYLFVALATVLLGLIASWEFGKSFALPAMWLMTPMLLLPEIDQYDVNTEMFMILPLIATVAVYCYSRQHGNKKGHWFAAGFLAAVTLLYKYTAAPVLAFVFVVWIAEMYLSRKKANLILLPLILAAGGILAGVLELGFFAAHGALKQFWECTIVFNRCYEQTDSFRLANLWSNFVIFWYHWWILFLLPLAIFLQPRPRAWFWLGIFISAIVATGASYYPQYYLAMMPWLALLNVLGIHALASKISGWMARPVPWLANFVTAIALLLVIRPDLRWMFYTRDQFAWEKTKWGLPFIEAQFVGAQVAQMSTPDDFVYVAGSEPEILCYAQRFSPTRFITSYALMIPTPLAAGYQHEVISALMANPPRFIVFPQSGYSWLRHTNTPPDLLNFMGPFLKQSYQLVGGYVKSPGQKGYWSTAPGREEFMNSSIVLYQLKMPPATNGQKIDALEATH